MRRPMTPGGDSQSPQAGQCAHRGWLGAVVVAFLLLGAAVPTETNAQVAPRFEVVSLSHQPIGRLTASVQVSDPKLLTAGGVTVLVDGSPRVARVMAPEDRGPLPVVVAVDTSGSMAGAPMTAARDAVKQLVAGLGPRDPVAVLAFANKAEVRAPFGVDRAATNAAVQGMTAAGDTALYQAVETASELAAGASGRGVVILISDGEDTSGQSLGRDTTLRSVVARGTPVYVFGVGSAIDTPYLKSLAEVSGGRYEAVANADALRRVFTDLGRTLATATSIEVAVPPLTKGNHSALFRVGDKTPIERAVTFEVGNAGMLAATASVPSDPTTPIAIKVAAAVPLATLNLKLRVEGRDTAISSTGEAVLDPWTVAPGVKGVEVLAMNDAGVVAQTQLQVTVAELQPALNIKRQAISSGEQLTISGRVQSPAGQTIVVKADGDEVLRSRDPIVQADVSRGSKVTVELLAGDRVALTEALQIGSASSAFNSLPMVGGMVTLLAIGAWLVLMRKRSLDPSAAVMRALQPATVQPANHVVPIAGASQAAEQMTNIIVRTPEGQTRRILVRRGAALTIGTDSTCDIRLADDTVRARHGLLSRMEDGHFELYPITGRPADDASVTARVLLRPGDPVRIGQHVLVIE